MENKEKTIERLVSYNNDLVAKVLEQSPKVAVMPSNNDMKHVLHIYKYKSDDETRHHYKFVRPQKRNLPIIDPRVWLKIYEKVDVPNAMNILNVLKLALNKENVTYYVSNPNEITIPTVDIPTLLSYINAMM